MYSDACVGPMSGARCAAEDLSGGCGCCGGVGGGGSEPTAWFLGVGHAQTERESRYARRAFVSICGFSGERTQGRRNAALPVLFRCRSGNISSSDFLVLCSCFGFPAVQAKPQQGGVLASDHACEVL